jgi:DNA polymerase-3 subunit gamma/tau
MEEYLVIARKYRPQQFNEVIGQAHVSTTLTNAIKTGRMAHAYLFNGPKGIGKTTIARIFAKALNCAEGPTPTPCGKCPSCLEITKGNSMDVMEIDGASNRGIEEIRTLRDNVKFAPSGNRFKIYIIDEVHMLTPEAFNALLKTLEEPPAHVKFLFATTEPHRMPSTILSRCQRFELKRIQNNLIVDTLKNISIKEKIKISDSTLETIARYANGSLRDAESTLDKLIAYSGNDINHAEALTILGIVDKDMLLDLSRALAESNITKSLNIVTDIFEQGKDLEQFLMDTINHFRNILLSKYSPEVQKLIDMPSDDVKKIIELGKQFSQTRLLEIINILNQIQGELKWSLSKRTALEVGFIKIAKTASKIGLDELVERLEKIEKNMHVSDNKQVYSADSIKPHAHSHHQHNNSEQNEESTPAIKTSGTGSTTKTLESVKNYWDEILAGLGKSNPLIKSYLAEGKPIEFKDGVLTIGFDPTCALHQESLTKKQNKELLEKRFEEKLGAMIRINFILLNSMAKPTVKPQDIIDNPLVEKVRQKFGAKIINIKT